MVPRIPQVAAIFLLAAVVWVLELSAQRQPLQEEKIDSGTLVSVLPADAIPAVTNPSFMTRAEAERLMEKDEPVLGLVDPGTGQAKAYSLWHLDRHEIVNDRLGRNPIAVTW